MLIGTTSQTEFAMPANSVFYSLCCLVLQCLFNLLSGCVHFNFRLHLVCHRSTDFSDSHRSSVFSVCTANANRLFQLCGDNRSFLFNMNFRHHSSCIKRWYPNSIGTLSHIDRILVSYRWRSSVQICRLYVH